MSTRLERLATKVVLEDSEGRNIPVQIETQASLLSEAKAEIERLGKVAEEAISVLRSTAPELARSTAHQGRRLSLYFHLMEQEKAKEKTDAN